VDFARLAGGIGRLPDDCQNDKQTGIHVRLLIRHAPERSLAGSGGDRHQNNLGGCQIQYRQENAMKLPRFTLRDLFWLVLVCSLVVGWWVASRQRSSDQERLLTLISYLNTRGHSPLQGAL
jgi:hypothetical protein